MSEQQRTKSNLEYYDQEKVNNYSMKNTIISKGWYILIFIGTYIFNFSELVFRIWVFGEWNVSIIYIVWLSMCIYYYICIGGNTEELVIFFFMVKFLKISFKKNPQWSRPGSNRRPSACKADVITTTLRDQIGRRWLIVKFEFEVENINLIYT